MLNIFILQYPLKAKKKAFILQFSSMKVLTYMIQALCFVLKFFRGVASKFLGKDCVCGSLPRRMVADSQEEWLLLLHLEFLNLLLYTVVLILLDSSLVLCQMY